MSVEVAAELAPAISAGATAVYAVISAISLWLLSRQLLDARRFGSAPALYALLKELEEHMAAIRRLEEGAADEPATRETITRYLDFFERIEHLRNAGVLPTRILAGAFGPALTAHLADPRFVRIIQQEAGQHEEVLRLAQRLGRRPRV